jgi:hypothetical protein
MTRIRIFFCNDENVLFRVVVFTSSPWEALVEDTGNDYHLLQDIDGKPPGGATDGSGSSHQ